MTQTHPDGNRTGRNKGGRPKLPDGEKCNCPVKVYFDRTNYTKLIRRSRRTGRPLSGIVYELGGKRLCQGSRAAGRGTQPPCIGGHGEQPEPVGAPRPYIHGPQHITDENRRLSREISGLIVELNKQL